jgi:hypothetical protein
MVVLFGRYAGLESGRGYCRKPAMIQQTYEARSNRNMRKKYRTNKTRLYHVNASIRCILAVEAT